MALERSKGFVRARQRSRTALRAFSEDLQPLLQEISIDKVRLKFVGQWTTRASAADYKSYLAVPNPDVLWLKAPEQSVDRVKLKSLVRPHSTISGLEITIGGFTGSRGKISAIVQCNPTRTLAHLLQRFPDEGDFPQLISALSAPDFFAPHEVALAESLDGNDNWIEDMDRLIAALGADPFSAFLPIFVIKLFDLILHLVSPDQETSPTVDGCDFVYRSDASEIRLNGDIASIVSIETYFERHHSRAAAIVKTMAHRMLASLDQASVSYHPERVTLERRDILLSVVTALPNDRKLGVYAKAPNRLRFEVRRPGRGRYPNQPRSGPCDRLLGRMNFERGFTLTACRWLALGRLFTETPSPTIGDFTHLVSEVSSACISNNCDPRPIFQTLLRDGGLTLGPDDSANFAALLKDLQKRGILNRVTLRKRDRPSAKRRIGLSYDQATVFQRALEAFGDTTNGNAEDQA